MDERSGKVEARLDRTETLLWQGQLIDHCVTSLVELAGDASPATPAA